MPRGAHFKKNNPRNTQVSFKVNDTEMALLKTLAAESGLSIPDWIRTKIKPNAKTEIEKHQQVQKPVKAKAKPKKVPAKKAVPKNPDQQISLF